jgi:GNAT superfamily N-acetyltransferase
LTEPRVRVRDFNPTSDIAWAERLLETELAGRFQARRGELVDALEGSGLVEELDGRPIGLVMWVVADATAVRGGEAEIRVLVVAPDSRWRGAGSVLLGWARRALLRSGVTRAWLVTTNDNLDALGFYQRRGWRLTELHPGAVDEARRLLKPEIGQVAANAIPIRDELVLEIELGAEGWPGDPTSIPGHLG